MRQIILDTETTGIQVADGHRIIEIGCLEMVNRKLTGRHFHYYINPEREIEAGAIAVHGITNEFLKDKPSFTAIAKEFLDFITNAELIIHNAPFDLGFLNAELARSGTNLSSLMDCCRSVIDTLQIARKLHVGQRNSLDALCKRYGIDNSTREFHGALLDAHLLAQVYLAMTGGQGNFFDSLAETQAVTTSNKKTTVALQQKRCQMVIIEANAEERAEHEKYLLNLKNQGKCLWMEN